MTTDRAGPEGTIGIAIDKGREGGDHSAVVLYWMGPKGLYVLDSVSPITPRQIARLDALECALATCGQSHETP